MEQTLHSNISFCNRLVAVRAGVSLRKFGDIAGGDTAGRQTPSGYDETDHDFIASVLLSPKTSLTMLYQNVSQKNIPVYQQVVLENYAVNQTDPQKRRLAYVRLNTDIDAGMMKSGIITASYQQTREGSAMNSLALFTVHSFDLPLWNIFNLNGGYTWNFLAADLSFRNILNKDYRYHGSGINGYGRSLFLTFQANF
ncbi:MAG: hypothetical protein WAW07_14340 [Bacteroidales bacterium]